MRASQAILRLMPIFTCCAVVGCQSLGGYSAQSITRVPPIGTGSYQVPGSYYGNAAPPNSTAANNAAAPANNLSVTLGDTSGLQPVTTAQFSDIPSTSGSSPVVGAAAAQFSDPQLQWQP